MSDETRDGGDAGVCEKWRPVPGWKHYEVSDRGRIRSVDRLVRSARSRSGFRRCRGKDLKAAADRRGNVVVTLCEDGVMANLAVMRIVASAFMGLDLNDKTRVVYAANGDRTECGVQNIQIGTQKDAAENARMWGAYRTGEDNPAARLSRHGVRTAIDRLATGEPAAVIAAALGVSRATIELIASGRTWREVEYGHRFARADIGEGTASPPAAVES